MEGGRCSGYCGNLLAQGVSGVDLLVAKCGVCSSKAVLAGFAQGACSGNLLAQGVPGEPSRYRSH